MGVVRYELPTLEELDYNGFPAVTTADYNNPVEAPQGAE